VVDKQINATYEADTNTKF